MSEHLETFNQAIYELAERAISAERGYSGKSPKSYSDQLRNFTAGDVLLCKYQGLDVDSGSQPYYFWYKDAPPGLDELLKTLPPDHPIRLIGPPREEAPANLAAAMNANKQATAAVEKRVADKKAKLNTIDEIAAHIGRLSSAHVIGAATNSAPAPNAAAQPAAKGQITETFLAHFADDVLKARTPVLVNFSATWCDPCEMEKKELEKLAQEYLDTLKIVSIDVDRMNKEAGVVADKLAKADNLMKNVDPKNTAEQERIIKENLTDEDLMATYVLSEVIAPIYKGSIPMILVFDKGQLKGGHVGYLSENDVKKKITTALTAKPAPAPNGKAPSPTPAP